MCLCHHQSPKNKLSCSRWQTKEKKMPTQHIKTEHSNGMTSHRNVIRFYSRYSKSFFTQLKITFHCQQSESWNGVSLGVFPRKTLTLIFTASPFFIHSMCLAFAPFRLSFVSISITLHVNVIVDPFSISLKFRPSIVAPLKKGESISITSANSVKY